VSTDPRLAVLEALSRVLSDPAGCLALVADADDEDDAARRLRNAYGFDAVQAQAVLDLQFRSATRSRRAAMEAELRTVQDAVSAPWDPPLQLPATVRYPRLIEVDIDGVLHRFDGADLADCLHGLIALVRQHLARPARRNVVVTITGSAAGPTGVLVDPVGSATFSYDDEAPT
jgi:hypothetical protein